MSLDVAAVRVGDTHEVQVVADLTRTQIVQFAGASGDFNPLHTDEVFATRAVGNRTVMAHGMLVMGVTGRALTDLLGDGRLTSFGGRFRAPTWPGDDLHVQITVTGLGNTADGDPEGRFELTTRNQDGHTVFSGTATGRLDGLGSAG